MTDIPQRKMLRTPCGGSWKDSYSVGNRCYCDTTFDHDIGDISAIHQQATLLSVKHVRCQAKAQAITANQFTTTINVLMAQRTMLETKTIALVE